MSLEFNIPTRHQPQNRKCVTYGLLHQFLEEVKKKATFYKRSCIIIVLKENSIDDDNGNIVMIMITNNDSTKVDREVSNVKFTHSFFPSLFVRKS